MTTRTRIDFLPAIASRSDPLVEFTAATCLFSLLTHEVSDSDSRQSCCSTKSEIRCRLQTCEFLRRV